MDKAMGLNQEDHLEGTEYQEMRKPMDQIWRPGKEAERCMIHEDEMMWPKGYGTSPNFVSEDDSEEKKAEWRERSRRLHSGDDDLLNELLEPSVIIRESDSEDTKVAKQAWIARMDELYFGKKPEFKLPSAPLLPEFKKLFPKTRATEESLREEMKRQAMKPKSDLRIEVESQQPIERQMAHLLLDINFNIETDSRKEAIERENDIYFKKLESKGLNTMPAMQFLFMRLSETMPTGPRNIRTAPPMTGREMELQKRRLLRDSVDFIENLVEALNKQKNDGERAVYLKSQWHSFHRTFAMGHNSNLHDCVVKALVQDTKRIDDRLKEPITEKGILSYLDFKISRYNFVPAHNQKK
jgi:hypothetical protein